MAVSKKAEAGVEETKPAPAKAASKKPDLHPLLTTGYDVTPLTRAELREVVEDLMARFGKR